MIEPRNRTLELQLLVRSGTFFLSQVGAEAVAYRSLFCPPFERGNFGVLARQVQLFQFLQYWTALFCVMNYRWWCRVEWKEEVFFIPTFDPFIHWDPRLILVQGTGIKKWYGVGVGWVHSGPNYGKFTRQPTTLFEKILVGCHGEAPLRPHSFTIRSSNSNAKFFNHHQ